MKDKIVYLIIGLCIATIIMLLTEKYNNSTAERLTNENTKAFDNVWIKGMLYIGNEENKIILKSSKDGSDIILESKGSTISINTQPQVSSILITPDIEDMRKTGVNLMSQKKNDIRTSSLIRIKDDKGEKFIETSD